jgi:hypothetical protein
MNRARQNRRRKFSLRSTELHCVICGGTDRVQWHHIGGRNHVAWITAPLCLKHHDEFHLRLRLGESEVLLYTSDEQERHRRARQLMLAALAMLEHHRKNRKLCKGKGRTT